MQVNGIFQRRRTVVSVVAVITATALAVAGCGGSSIPGGEGTIVTTTTRIAGADLVTPERAFDASCGTESTVDPGKPDIARIAVTDPALLDAVCALGLQARVVAIATEKSAIPRYLGPAVTSRPTIGSSPSADAARAARADVVIGYDASSAAPFGGRALTIDRTESWQDQFAAVADGLGRSEEGKTRLDAFAAQAKRAGARLDASHTQVGLVRFGADSETIEGTNSYAGTILSAMGAQRPASQRQAGAVAVTDDNFTDADADLIYVSFTDTAAAEKHGTSVMKSDQWLDMGAPGWGRVLVVTDDIWYGGKGLAAAPIVMDDVIRSLNRSSQ
ncbi:ABC transporter substrate-binding protein [Williamsia phyllosphaerae]|uniref:Fe3+-citrate ABC transporter substrate-binding protein n=1 Tax=Williamsia phyllosphaerae TaxID=885042 RepID=A0ABQ1UX29_9NOCA|nr:Fe3+-citrate ABC transporter substrate-binding protein [Williamsia phyllosphaerae]